MDRMTAADPARLALASDGTLTLAGAAAFSGLSRSKICQLVRSGEVPSALVCGRRLIPRRGLVEFLAAHMPAEAGR